MPKYSVLKNKTNSDFSKFVLFPFGGERGIRTLVCFWHKLISSQPRYDHFDISPYMIKLKTSLIFIISLAGRPVMSCCGARNLLLAARFAKFRPLPLLIARFIRPRRRSQKSPLRYLSIYNQTQKRV